MLAKEFVRGRAAAIRAFYLLYFGSVGITLPFLPGYLKSRGLTGTQVGALLALSPVFTLVAPPAWGWLADRTGRPDRVLSAIGAGAVAGFLPLLWARSFSELAIVLALYAAFASSVTPVIDTLAIAEAERGGTTFSSMRWWGSLGFVLAAAGFGFLVPEVDARTVAVPLTLIVLYAASTALLRPPQVTVAPPHPLAALRLLKDPPLALLLAMAALHWIACAPYHGMLSIHVHALGLGNWVVGASASIGVLAEIGVMMAYPRLRGWLSDPALLGIAFLTSAVRWAGMALTGSGAVIVLLSLLHGLTFGAWYVATVSLVAARVPERLRASGQSLLAAITFGVGGIAGYLGSGVVYDAVGGHRLFAVAAAVELLPAALCLLLARSADAPAIE